MTSVTFTLKTNSLTNNATNDIGTSNNGRTLSTWSNIDLQSIMGYEMFNNYKKFNITLLNGEIEHVDNTPAVPYDRTYVINLYGLSFTSKKQYATMSYIIFGTTGNGQPSLPNVYNPVTFDKGGRYVDLTISLNKVFDNTLFTTAGVNAGGIPPQSYYQFRIDPIYE